MKTLEQVLLGVAEAIRPPERVTVIEAAEKYYFISNPGSYTGYYNRDLTPYMTEPGEVLTSLDHTAMVFVGPAQAGKTNLFLTWLIYTAKCDPADMMIVEKSQVAARDFSVRRVARLARQCPAYAETIIPGKHNQNTFDVRYKSGMLLSLSYPSINELSGKPVPRVWLSDYDRMPDDVDGEGAPFDLAAKRTTTFRRFAMTVAESTPGRLVENPRWMPSTPHEAPPTGGVLALYNRGDRRRWMWTCVSCNEMFEPSFSLLRWPKSKDIAEAAAGTYMPCPHCGQVYTHGGDEKNGVPGKRELNLSGRWVAEPGRKSQMASFWLKGPAAEFTDWPSLVAKYLLAKQELDLTGSEQALKTTVNTDQGEPYLPLQAASALLPEDLVRHRRPIGERVVPEGVRFLVSSVDVQSNRFEVATWGVYANSDMVLIDRYSIRKSERRDADGDPLPVRPGAHPEDWDLLLADVVRRAYPLADESGRVMRVRAIGVDSGGREGVTTNALLFWRRLRDEHNEHSRVLLLKGTPRDTPRVEVAYPDATGKKDRNSGARGDVPMLLLASNTLKDTAANRLARDEPGGGFVTFADWLPDTVYQELTVETRDTKGKWDNPRRLRNETWDLLCYAIALTLSPLVSIERIDWESPPTWAESWEKNSLVGEPIRFESQAKVEYDLTKLGSSFA